MTSATAETPEPKTPPPLDRTVQQFMDSSWAYLELVPRLQTYVTGTGRTSSASEAWSKRAEMRTTRRVIVLAMALGRKFVAPGEPTYLPRLVQRVEAERKDRIPLEKRKPLRTFGQRLTAEIGKLHDGGLTVSHADGTTSGPDVLWERVQYGHVLHGDHEKWADQSAWLATILTAARTLPRLRELIVMTRECMEELNKQNVFEGVHSEDTEWILTDVWEADGTPATSKPAPLDRP